MPRLTVFSKIVNLIYAVYLALLMLIAPNPAYVTSATTEHAALTVQGTRLTVAFRSNGGESAYWKYKDDAGDGSVLTLLRQQFVPDDPETPLGDGDMVFTVQINHYGVAAAHCYAEIPHPLETGGTGTSVKAVRFTLVCTITGKSYFTDVQELCEDYK